METVHWNRLVKETRLVKIYHFIEIDSTNNRARTYLARARKSLAGPVLFAADRQTAGRGRGDHSWWSPGGGLFLSYAARRSEFGMPNGESVEISLLTAQAVAQTIRRQFPPQRSKPLSVRVKHPNDVLLNGRKVCGILIESPEPETVIIGIGINLNTAKSPVPEELRERYISVEQTLGKTLAPLEFVTELTQRLFP